MQARQIEPDLAAIVESVYDIERDTRSWIAGILERLEPSIGDGVGLFGFEYVVSHGCRLQMTTFTCLDCAETMSRELPASAIEHAPEYCAAASEIRDWRESRPAQHARAAGILDNWRIAGRNHGNRGFAVIVNRRSPGSPSEAQRVTLTRIAKHFAAAHRLRERLAHADTEASAEVRGSAGRRAADAKPRPLLSPREREVLALAVIGHSNKQIAFELGIGHSTVRVLLTRAARKLDARGHAELLRCFEALETPQLRAYSLPFSTRSP